jgi:hypothetical protein
MEAHWGRCEHGYLVRPFPERVALGEVIPELFEYASWRVDFTETLAATSRTLCPDSVAMLDDLATKRSCLQCYGDYVETHHLILEQMLRTFRRRVNNAVDKTRSELARLENILKCISAAWDSLALTIEERKIKSTDTHGYVYAIEDGEYVKIGWAIDPIVRLSQLQTGSARQLRLLGAMRGVFTREGELHDRFRAHHHRGEWFVLSDEIRSYFLSTAARPAAEEPDSLT